MSDRHTEPPQWQPWQMGELPASTGSAKRRRQQSAQKEKNSRDDFQRLQQQLTKKQQAAEKQGYDEGYSKGHKKGHQAGLEQGLSEGQQQLDNAKQQFNEHAKTLLEGLQQALDQLDDDLSDTLVDVTLAAGLQLANASLESSPDQVLNLIKQLLQEQPLFGARPRLQLHPDDAALLDDSLHAALDEHDWKLHTDSAISRGGCRIVGPDGELDATREARWQALVKRVRRLDSRPGGHSKSDLSGQP